MDDGKVWNANRIEVFGMQAISAKSKTKPVKSIELLVGTKKACS